MNMYVVNMVNINMLIIMYMFYLTYGIKRLLFGKIENSTVHVYQASFLGVHAQTQWSKFHDTRLIGDTRLLGTPEYNYEVLQRFVMRLRDSKSIVALRNALQYLL